MIPLTGMNSVPLAIDFRPFIRAHRRPKEPTAVSQNSFTCGCGSSFQECWHVALISLATWPSKFSVQWVAGQKLENRNCFLGKSLKAMDVWVVVELLAKSPRVCCSCTWVEFSWWWNKLLLVEEWSYNKSSQKRVCLFNQYSMVLWFMVYLSLFGGLRGWKSFSQSTEIGENVWPT